MKNILEIEVSAFNRIRCATPRDKAVNISLYTFLKSSVGYEEQLQIAAIKDHSEYQAAKLNNLSAITPGALYEIGSSHGKNQPHKRTGIMQIDIDGKDNPHIENWETFRDELFAVIENTAYAGLSVSGKGCFLLIPVKYPERHEQHFNYVASFLNDNGIKVDTSKGTPYSARYYSFDPNAKYRLDANALEPLLEPKKEIRKEIRKEYTNQTKYGSQMPIWEQFNSSDEWERVLLSNGWSFLAKRGSELHYTRPGKTNGTSATFNIDKRVLNVFTDNGGLLTPGGLSPMGILATLEFNGDYKAATKYLLQNNFKN